MKVWSPGAKRWVEVEEVAPGPVARKPRPPFRAQWVKVPASWLTALRQTKSGSTKQLALEILLTKFQQKRGAIVLSAAMTGMPKTTRKVAARELVKLGLIEIEEDGRQAMRVVLVHT